MLSALEFGIGTAMAAGGLRAVWRLQHPLDLRGYVLQAGLFLLGLAIALVGFYMLARLIRVILFDCGIVLMGVFLLLPDLVYQLLRLYDERRGSSGS